ncbi:T9SS C-terminal target domain-containing protein [Flagellimonas eckloniae]|uniref:T9SS C-terminal target domain-containing protein n=1 Tax=Flagellimonas eckloniae TaxID=346185 RepID=UPI001585364A|nr:T9SS C-terminal target domain-containing protein [Allomuricauda eckloniae]
MEYLSVMRKISIIPLYIFLMFNVFIYGQKDLVQLGALDASIKETSGLIYYNGNLITHNDSGNTPQLFELNPENGEILRTVTITNAQNVDWEDLSQDENFIYVGDFGNNRGNREDLGFYIINKNEYQNSTTVSAERISFAYPDQLDFTTTVNSDWDAEAFFVLDDNLIVLTKQWQEMGTVAYKIPKTAGNHIAQRMDSYQIDGLITGSTYNETENKLVLTGYSELLFPFIVEIDGVSDTTIFAGTVSKSPLDIGIAQIEAIANFEDTYFITSEEFINSTPQIISTSRLFLFTLENIVQANEKLVLYQPDGNFLLNYRLDTEDEVFEQAIFDVSGRRVFYNPIAIFKDGSIDTSYLRPSLYFLSFFLEEGKVVKPFIIN